MVRCDVTKLHAIMRNEVRGRLMDFQFYDNQAVQSTLLALVFWVFGRWIFINSPKRSLC